MKKVNVIFMGTTQFSVTILETLKKISSVNLLGVVCQPDKAMDRNKNYIYSPVKQYCLNNNLTLYQPKSIIELKEVMINSQIDLIITCAYGQFVPDTILNIPTLGSYNIHASLLPKYRGGAPIHYAIINGDLSTGITLMKMSKKMDAGDIIFQKSCSISPTETYLSLSSKLAIVASELLEEK
ncbi:methionyl-tRNA formyltransferase [bacterium]|nr:methionyl-tRNA formyltransferase [bacterium]